MSTRRGFVLGGIGAAAALAIAGAIYELRPDSPPADRAYHFTELDEDDRAIVAAIAPVMLADALPKDALRDVVRGTDTAIAGLPLSVRAELAQLFGILRFAPSRMLIAGVWKPWNSADSGEIAGFLNAWRFSRFARLRSAYGALHQLVMASWYGNSAAWPATGYPGPPSIAR